MKHFDNLLIWDVDGTPPTSDSLNIHWRGFVRPGSSNGVSIPCLVEKNADELRSRYLAWIYERGETVVDGKRLVDHLQLRSGLSYWWMTLIAEKCNFAKSPLIEDAIRLFAFDEWAKQLSSIKSVKLVSRNIQLRESLKNWCKNRKIHFEFQYSSDFCEHKPIIRRTYDALPQIIQASVWLLKYLIDRWPLRGIGVELWRSAVGRITFVDYLCNLVPYEADKGRFKSLYWTGLPDALDAISKNSCWLHIYVHNPVIPDAKSAAKLLSVFNVNQERGNVHVTLDSFLSIKEIINTIRNFLKLLRFGRFQLSREVHSDVEGRFSVNSLLWPLHRKDWSRSFFGIDALQNMLLLNLFEEALANLPIQSVGVYLQENQGWESGMISAWRVAKHQKLIGFPHTTVRFWDLRYFFDSMSYLSRDNLALPRPDYVAVSGEAIKNAYKEGKYPSNNLIEVEALRYLHLEQLSGNLKQQKPLSKDVLRVLVLSDYLHSNTVTQMRLLQEIANELSNIELTVKPHPACSVDQKKYPELMFKLSNKPISDLLSQFDVAYTSNTTSAAVDAYCGGLKVISVMDPSTLNISPLRGLAGVKFVSSPLQLLQALEEVRLGVEENQIKVRYFNLDSSLPGWLSLLS